MAARRPDPDPSLAVRVAPYALALPGAYEEDAWTGLRWRVRGRTFAHVMALHHADAVARLGAAPDAVVTVVRLRCVGPERAALAAIGQPYLPADDDEVLSVVLGPDTDWEEVGELVTESWRVLAPARLVAELDTGPGP
ncbi:MmcQ/YjbR family DNA-binding protein [Nocardioides sp. CFH 31398]|uniref:MmcQ/YjbR family DNA-binding protein n=1 Tax=Nocardioides sp. CFH 31398 TaxID=2919579 RepID=UPI001F05ED73|nr:MmcQ/YjbR family DNA-binding protein [Nocardioides sp. CFH 31398]MCH1868512.1 MmcQ/YjbR family DNA-binding protein [Nocardioides sp. CFH 31398]